MFIAQVLVGPSKQLKQIIQIQHKLLRIPTGRRQTSWLFTRAAEKLNSGYRDQHQLVVRTGFEPATYRFQIRRSNHSATLPPCLIVAPWKFDVLKTGIFALEASLLGQIFVLGSSNFRGATICRLVPRQKHSIV